MSLGLDAAGTVVDFILQLHIFHTDSGAGIYRLGDKSVGTDDGIPADDCFAAQNGSTGVDGHVVFNGGMTLAAFQTLTASGSQAAQGDALVDFDVLTNDGGLTNDDAGSVVNEEMGAYGGTGVNVDAGNGMGEGVRSRLFPPPNSSCT